MNYKAKGNPDSTSRNGMLILITKSQIWVRIAKAKTLIHANQQQ
jgi:hypothetical protein